MDYFSLTPKEAWRDVLGHLKSDYPVTAVFRQPGDYGSGIIVEVDGQPINTYISLKNDGTWEATYFVKPLGK